MESRPKKDSSHKYLDKESKNIDSLEEKLGIVQILHVSHSYKMISSDFSKKAF